VDSDPAWGLLERMVDFRWGLLWTLLLLGVAGAVVARRNELALFAALWIVLSPMRVWC
jgi:hypothetical protein